MGKKKGNRKYWRLNSGKQDEMNRQRQDQTLPSQSQLQAPLNNNSLSNPSPGDGSPTTLDGRVWIGREQGRADPREVFEGTSRNLPIYQASFQDVMDDQRQPTLQAGASSVLHHPPPKSPRDRHAGGLFGGTSGNVVIKGGTLHNTYGHHTNVTIQFTPPREEYYEASPQHLLPPLLINHNPTLPHTQDIHHGHIPPIAIHDQGPSLPIPNITSPPISDIHGIGFPPMTMPSQGHSTSTIGHPPDNSNKIYERHLELKRRGFPLWIPEPNRTLPMPYRRKGVDIGDVGIITPSGGFSFLFNICLPAGHPINPPMLPEGFVPIHPPIDTRDIREFSEFKPESYLASTAIEKINNEPPFRGLSFATSSAEGALLTLPDGAITRDLENIRRFRKYAEVNIENWYRYANGPRGREVKNGEVRLVTGCDKASSWGMAAVANTAQPKMHHLKYRSVDNDGAQITPISPIPLYRWEYTGVAEARVGPDLQEIEDLRKADSKAVMGEKYRNQCLFVRTLNITLSDDAFAKINRDLESPSQQFQNSGGSSSPIGNPPNSGVQTGNNSERSVTNLEPMAESIYESLGSPVSPTENPASGSVITEVTSRSPISPISHPADILNKLLLQKVPKSRVVITRDEDWSSVINEDDEIMSNPSEIAERVLAANNIREEDGVVFLEPKKEPQPVLPLPSQSHSHSPSLSGSTSVASSEWEYIPTPELRTSTLDTSSSVLDSQPHPILLDESELFKNMNPQDIIIAVMGPSGTGKSSFINMLLGSEVAVTSGGLVSCTQKVHAFGCVRPGRSDQKIIVVDTPGFDDTLRTDYEVLEGIAKWLESTYSKRIKLSGLLHFHSIRESRMKRTPQRNLGMFQRLCGHKALKNVVLLTTFWDELEDESVGSAREKQLSELFWKPLIDKGSRTERFDPQSYERAWEIVDRFPPATGIPLAIQVEMVDEHKELWETSVFKFLVQWWTQIVNAIRGFAKDSSQTDPETNHALRQKDALVGKMPGSASSISMKSVPSPTTISSLELAPKWFQARRKKKDDKSPNGRTDVKAATSTDKP